MCRNCRYVLVRAERGGFRALPQQLQGSSLDVSSGDTHARGFP
jgi:hypothetical protein